MENLLNAMLGRHRIIKNVIWVVGRYGKNAYSHRVVPPSIHFKAGGVPVYFYLKFAYHDGPNLLHPPIGAAPMRAGGEGLCATLTLAFRYLKYLALLSGTGGRNRRDGRIESAALLQEKCSVFLSLLPR